MDQPFINTVTFTPRFSGWDYVSWTDPRSNTVSDVPNVVNPDTWSWSPNNSSDYWDTGICQMWMGTIYYQDGHVQGQPSGAKTYAVSYTATDNLDGVSATAKANVQLHDQWENKQNGNPATTLNQHRTYMPGNVGSTNYTKVKLTVPPSITGTITAAVSLGGKFSLSFETSWCKALGIEVNLGLNIGASIAISTPGPLLDPGFSSYPFILTTWITNNYLVDNYTTAGFAGTFPQSADNPNGYTNTLSWCQEQPIGKPPPP